MCKEQGGTQGSLVLFVLALATCGVVLFMLPQPIRAQAVTTAITGTVTDPSHAAIPGATIIATDVLRGTTWPTTTNAAGVYNLPRLPVGHYSVEAEKEGFATVIHPAFELQMNQIYRVNFELKLGRVTQTVSVTAAPPLLQTDTMQVGLVTTASLNVNLPLPTRNFVELTLLTPGVTSPNPTTLENGQRTYYSGRTYINGNREEANNFLLDGIDNNETLNNLTGYQPSVDAIQEFDVITNNAPAQYGQFQGGVISTTIKSGTNRYHGDIFEFLRNDALNANAWANNWQDLPTPGMRWNMFGGTLGGPIRKNKLFFFADYQGQRYDFPAATSAITVMTSAERSGDFSQILAQKGIQLYNPFNYDATTGQRAPFTNDIIPASMIDPVAGKLFSSRLYPSPVNKNVQFNAYDTTYSELNNDQGDVRIDYDLSTKDQIFGRYSQGFQTYPSYNSVLLLGQGFNTSPFHAAVIDWTHDISPSIVSDARIGLDRVALGYGADVPGVGNFAQSIGIADGNTRGPGLLGLDFSGGLANNLGQEDNEAQFTDTTIEPMEDLIITKGRHTIRLGFQAMRHQINAYYAGNNGKYGYLSYNGQYTSGPTVLSPVSPGFPEADFFLGLPQSVDLGIAHGTTGQRSWVLGVYGEDDWRVNDHLTLNLGLRWEYNQPWYEVFNRQDNFGLYSGVVEFPSESVMGNCAAIFGSADCAVSSSRALYDAYWRDWEPRFGFAYTPPFLRKNTVLRGAYTISSFLEGSGENDRMVANPPFSEQYSAVYSTGSQLILPGSTTDQGFSILEARADPYAGAQLNPWNPNFQPGIIQQWNLSVEHQFPRDTLLSVGYVGQHGVHLLNGMNYNQLRLPGIAGCPSTASQPCHSPYLYGNPTLYNTSLSAFQVQGTDSNGLQAYDALQASLTKHMSQGLELQISYTYAKAMANSIGYYGDGGQTAQNYGYWEDLYNMAAEWGPAYFDVTHTFTAAYVYQLPFGHKERLGNQWNPIVNGILGNWQLSGIVSYHTGFPITIMANDLSETISDGPRANCIAPVTYPDGVGPGTTWFSTSSFSQPAALTLGTCANGTVRGPGLGEWDTGFEKEFPISESKRLEFRAEFINFTNTPIFNAPVQSEPSSQFGEILSAQGQRNIQFALKLYF
jgi:outer membrane receptor protein involved in Fe transport